MYWAKELSTDTLRVEYLNSRVLIFIFDKHRLTVEKLELSLFPSLLSGGCLQDSEEQQSFFYSEDGCNSKMAVSK